GLRSALIAATNRQHGSGDVGGLVGSEEQNRRGLFGQSAVALHQRGLGGLLDDGQVPLRFLRGGWLVVARHLARRRLGATRCNRVDAHAAGAALERQRRGQRIDATL